MDEKPSEQKRSGISRRRFVGAMGAAGAAGAFLQRGGPANAGPSQVYYYQDSFGNVVPAGSGAIELGIYPPPIPAAEAPSDAANPDTCGTGVSGTTYYACTYPRYNILLIIVDQMRNPAFWLPSGNNWMSSFANAMPNLVHLANQSFIFPNYFVAATVCTPSRACLLTGLYSQQTCIFQTGGYGQTPVPPPLLPYNNNWSSGNNAGFPTIGNVLSQKLPVGNSTTQQIQYDCTWIGKWHESCASGVQDGLPGENGPSDYGFSSNNHYNLPTTSPSNPYPAGQHFGQGYASPNGDPNGGTGGDFLDSQIPAHDCPNWSPTLKHANNTYVTPAGVSALNDAAIAAAFTNFWLPNANTNLNNDSGSQLLTPWFCAVSFVNPHDISDFPWSFALASNNSYFVAPGNPVLYGYQPPPANSSNNTYSGNNCYTGSGATCLSDGDETTITAFPNIYTALPPGTGNNGHWNWEDLASQPYSSYGKPGLQQWFQTFLNGRAGTIVAPGAYNNSNNSWSTPGAWETFLNYYAWLQSCVDYQIGWVLGTNPESDQSGFPSGLKQYSTFWNNTVIIFTSDHGDFGGSHGLHAKGDALYDEALNAPLFISYPPQRFNNSSVDPIILPYVCSGVDLLPYLYTLALGNDSWRTNPNDMVFYLTGREAINDAINQFSKNNNYQGIIQQRRISGIPFASPFGSNNWSKYQPFVLHTCDETPFANLGNNTNPDYQPSHAIAFRTVDQTDAYNNAAPFAGQTSYGGGKLGIYSFWDTCDATQAPIMGINNSQAPNQYEYYNYSANATMNRNPQEVGNQFFNNTGGNSTLGQEYYNDFFNIGSPAGANIQGELYSLTTYGNNGLNIQQVKAAIQTAFNNYIGYLECTGSDQMSGNNGLPSACGSCSNSTDPYSGGL